MISLTDSEIVALMISRDASAVGAVKEKYGSYLLKTAYNILGDAGESEECLDDVLLGAWRSVPPNMPENLRSYLIMLMRRTCIDRLRKRGREKRSEYSVSLDELSEVIPSDFKTEREVETRLLGEKIDAWLRELPAEKRRAFVLRYGLCEPIDGISERFGWRTEKTKSLLCRLRRSLKAYLEKEDIL